MFLEKYLNEIYLELLYDKYEELYINSLDENKFLNIYKLFRKYEFYFIEDIIINYLEIFELEIEEVEKGILNLKEKLGNNFIVKIGNDLTYLDELLENNELEDK